MTHEDELNFIYEYIKHYIDIYPGHISFVDFEDNLFYDVLEMYQIYKDTQNELPVILESYETHFRTALKQLYHNYIPCRSFEFSGIRKPPNVARIQQTITKLRGIPQPEQRTEEWYHFRYNLITASNAYKCFEGKALRNSIIYEKCQPLDIERHVLPEGAIVNTSTTLHWGQKYEPLSVLFYEEMYETRVGDFGCIPHTAYSFLGASPDGINVDDTNIRYGRMLEIKNIVNREITGIPKKEYWVQMQLQMEVCDLNECDFLETRFKEYESREDFCEDKTHKKGRILHFIQDGKPIYEYAWPTSMDDATYELWENTQLEKSTSREFVRTIYWYLDELSCVLVLRNKKWFSWAIDEIRATWDIIAKERVEGYCHRAPKKRERAVPNPNSISVSTLSGLLNNQTREKQQPGPQMNIQPHGCLMDLSNNVVVVKKRSSSDLSFDKLEKPPENSALCIVECEENLSGQNNTDGNTDTKHKQTDTKHKQTDTKHKQQIQPMIQISTTPFHSNVDKSPQTT